MIWESITKLNNTHKKFLNKEVEDKFHAANQAKARAMVTKDVEDFRLAKNMLNIATQENS